MIKKVETKEEALECNRLLTMLIQDEKRYDSNINDSFEVSDWFEHLYFKNDSALYIDIEDNKIVGYIYIKIKDLDITSIKTVEALIDGLYVLKEYRNRRIATNLIEHAKEWCISKNINAISLNVMYNNDIARKLYNKFGFENFSITLKCKI